MKIAHIVNNFDPSCDALRCAQELNKYSKHEHKIWVKIAHPVEEYQFEIAPRLGDLEFRAQLLDWCDAIIYQYAGHELGEDYPSKPAAFRNICIYGPGPLSVDGGGQGLFWCPPYPSALTPRSFDRYKLVSSCCVGAEDFLPQPFRWLPDLVPLDGAYAPDWSDRPACVSYIKHASKLSQESFMKHLNMYRHPHEEVLRRRRSEASVVIDNVEDGHWGLAGAEAIIMGLPTVVYLHEKTKKSLMELTGGEPGPFIEVGESVEEAAEAARRACISPPSRTEIREKAVRYFNPKRLIEKYWDPFVEELVS